MNTPSKQWKHSPEDLIALIKYEDLMGIYSNIIENTSDNPWIIVPTDRKWCRNCFTAKTLEETIKELALVHPEPKA